MVQFSEKFLDEVAERSDIVDVVGQYVHLTKKSGSNLFGLCPFHSEKTPSFSVAPDKQIYHCFGCGKGGGVINFIMEIENLSFPEAVGFLARRANLPMPAEEDSEEGSRRRRLLELNREAARFFYQNLISPQGAPARAYVNKRRISPAMVKNFGLGYAPDSWNALTDAMRAKGYSDKELFEAGLMKHGKNGGGYDAFRNRLMFPVIDVRGSVIGFSGRILGDGEPKYLNSPETPVFSKSHNLFALNLAKKSKSGYILLAEGNIDVVSLHQAGFDSAVASLGTSLTPEQARLISRFTDEVIICYDGDEAGKKATQRAIGILQKLDLKVRVLQLPLPPGAKKIDPDEFIQTNGPDAFRNILEGSAGQVEYRLGVIESKSPPTTDEGRVEYMRSAVSLLATLPGQVEREIYARRVAEKVGVSREALIAEVERVRHRKIKAAAKENDRMAARVEQTVQPRQKELRYEDPVSARAEEGIIRLLHTDPGLADGRELPTPEQFTSPLLRRLYEEILRRIREQSKLSMAVLSGEFTPEEVSHLTRVLNGTEDMTKASKALEDYIAIVTGKDSGGTDDEDLLAFQKELIKTKSFGG